MGWQKFPEFETFSLSVDDNPFVGPISQPTNKILEECVCKKLEKLNITLVEGYPSISSEVSCLQNEFVKTPWSQNKWYEINTDKQTTSSSTVSFWYNESAKHESHYNCKIIRGLINTTGFPVYSQETLRK